MYAKGILTKERNDMHDPEKLNTAALSLKKGIDALNAEIERKNEILEVLQSFCTHPGVEEDCGHKIGTCSVCLKKFLDRCDVDAIFSN